jgi:hypothetical protein
MMRCPSGCLAVIQIEAWPGKPIARKIVAPLYHGQLGKYVRERARSGVAIYEIGSSLLEHRRYPTIVKGVFEG